MRKLEGTNIFIAERDLKDNGMQAEVEKGKWAIARPIGFISFWHTLTCAIKVLKHEADIIIWKQYEIK
jgi:hypothetical protein